MLKNLKQLLNKTDRTISAKEINQLSAFFDILIKIDQRIKKEKRLKIDAIL